MYVTVHAADGAQTFRIPINAKTCIGQVLQDVAYKVTSKPNLLNSSLFYRNTMLPLDMRACALPENAELSFVMKMFDTAVSDDVAMSAVEKSRVNQPLLNCVLMVQLPNSRECRRVQVNSSTPVSQLRQVLDVPSDFSIFYNKRPILDEERTFSSLRMTDQYLVTFGQLVDNSFLTTPIVAGSGGGSATVVDNSFALVAAGGLGGQSAVRPRGLLNTVPLEQLRSPTKKSTSSKPPLAVVNNSAPVVAPPPASSSVTAPPPESVARGNLFDGVTVHSRNSNSEDFTDLKMAAAQWGPPPLPPPQPPSLIRTPMAVPSTPKRPQLYGEGGEDPYAVVNRSNVSAQQYPVLSNSSNRGASSGVAHQGPSHIKIFVSDPEDGGFTHDVVVNSEKKVSSLRQFVESPNDYDIYCDTVLVPNDEYVTFREATGGSDGSIFTFQKKSFSAFRR